MFDLRDEQSTRVIKGDPESRLRFDEPEASRRRSHPLDSDKMHELHRRLMGHYQRELDRQHENRLEMAQDEDFYDNIQWSEEDARVLRERGQAPLTYNVIAQTINWIIGSEKRGRTDFQILPRGKEDAKPAERKTALLKYLSDVNRTPFHRSRAFEDMVKVGIGWLEDGVTDDDDGEPVYSRYESWRNMLWDSACTELDLSDCRYVIRTKWVDLDIAIAMFPDREELLRRSAQEGDRIGYDMANGDEVMDFAENELDVMRGSAIDSADNRRDRVRLIEIWFRRPERVQKLVGGQFSGEVFEQDNPNQAQELQAGNAVLAERVLLRMHCAVMTVQGLLYFGPSPYRHNKFPFTPIWGYRRGRDGMPYGVTRGLKDIQEDINKRASKALFILSSNKVIMEKGAVDDLAEMEGEAARPNGIIVVNPNKRFEMNADRELAPAHLELMARSIQMIQSVSGVTDELMGRTTNATSGIAVQARQEQGAMSTSKLFDNLRLAVQIQGEKQLSLVEQYFTEQKTFRITNSRGTQEYVDINDGLPENDIVRTKADFVVSDADWRASMRQAQAEQLMEMMTRMPPQVAMVMLDLVVESMDFPNREEMVKRIRQVTGQRDPDAEELSPEEQQAMQAQQQQAQMQQEMLMVQMRRLAAQAMKDEAAAQKAAAELIKTNVEIQEAAVNTAQTAMRAPGLLPVADGIMEEAGFVSAPDQMRMQQEAEQAQMAEQQAMEQAAMEQQMQQQGDGAMPQQMAPDGAAQQPAM
ncbi:MAG TPA: hypothetical protein VKY70_12410 [Pseudomonas sp.]|nr:hypothetical protein [Pseudomonas sp.]